MALKKKTLRQLSREPPNEEELTEIVAESKTGSDRSSTIITCTHLQDRIAGLILLNLARGKDADTVNRMYERDGPLSTFYGQIQLGFAMGLFSDEIRKDLTRIRAIRSNR